ncbi:LacI family DNA-binding transcriptional regulator [Sphingomonas sp. AP4-R1]|uniref:LacI family DNA-binding transcriptional regulator n=1 Tax=Sphingomonas sp. AP4-R1 TaxID=2735134 RepID=UPI0014937BF3|nr:LacI family DNA-binding transcriptional regulator [Sphingomonas sp. AP4-R1]QJU59062.1 LacI family DNA-binding transcriptional regulator [Sphingomonas sp. AP4-R1]
MMVSRAPRLDDVAALAGVSTASVSRYLNNPGVVAPATAERIRDAIEQTNYLPNLNAGALASKRSRLIAALVPDIAQSIFNDTMEAMIERLTAEGNSVVMSLTGPNNHRLESQIDAALSRRVDAIILTGIVGEPALRARLRRQATSVIETWDLPDDPIDVAVGFSHAEVGADMARFLHGRGYRRPHLVVPGSPRSARRASRFSEQWIADGGSEPSRLIVNIPSHFGQGRLAFRGLADLPERPDVVVCGSDWIAQGLIVEALAAGVRVPDQLAVTGFGNLRLAGDMRPTITSVDIDGGRIAAEVNTILRTRAAGGTVPSRHVDVGFRIIARESA